MLPSSSWSSAVLQLYRVPELVNRSQQERTPVPETRIQLHPVDDTLVRAPGEVVQSWREPALQGHRRQYQAAEAPWRHESAVEVLGTPSSPWAVLQEQVSTQYGFVVAVQLC